MALHEKLDELRHREMLAVRDQLTALAGQVKGMEERISGRSPSE